MKICIHKNILGTDMHLSTNFKQAVAWVNVPEATDYLYGFEGQDSFDVIKYLAGTEVPSQPLDKFRSPFRHTRSRQIMWSKSMPKKAYSKYFQSIQNKICDTLASDQHGYFNERIRPLQHLICNLQPAHINNDIYMSHFSDPNTVNKSVLASFNPTNGQAKKVDYNLIGTATGRLTVLTGPNILTLKKDMRDILTSRFEGGKIMQFDYDSLEPRVALILAGKMPTRDIYVDLCKKVLGGKYGRQTAKLLTIATLYGMGVNRVKELLGVSKITAREVLDKLELFFGVADIKSQLETQAESGCIKNHFGRNIWVRNSAPHVLYNNYIQSTAMDAALEGFYNIVEGVKENGHKCVPIFLLHDAIIFDCHPDTFDKLEDIMKPGQSVPAFDSKLYMSEEEV